MERRNNYTTPTSFLEFIKFYQQLLGDKRGKIIENIERLRIGLQTMDEVSNVVADLQVELDETMKIVDDEIEATGKIITVVDEQSADAAKEQAIAQIQEDETNLLADAAKVKMAACDVELASALPLIRKAEAAVDCLSKSMIDELKSFNQLANGVDLVVQAVLLLNKKEKKYSWDAGKKMMNNPNKFIEELKEFDKENIDEWILVALEKLTCDPIFTVEIIEKKSKAAGTLCTWALAIISYNKVYKFVKPLEDEAAVAKNTAETKLAELEIVQAKVANIMEQVQSLKDQLAAAEAKKANVEARAAALNAKLDLANRLVGGLADENKRWKESVITLSEESLTMIGNAIISAAFVSYIGPFSQEFRREIWEDEWLVDCVKNKIPHS